MPLYEQVAEQQSLLSKDYLHDLEFDELAHLLLHSVGRVLLDVYHSYFDHEAKGNYDDTQMKKLSEKVLFEFLKDYDICPTLVSKSVAYKIFMVGLNSQQQVYQQTAYEIVQMHMGGVSFKTVGRVFSFPRFLDIIVRYAKTSYGTFEADIHQISGGLIQSEMICLLLERMELSKGFLSFEKRVNRPHTSR
jgi:hypothetical protein